MTNKRCLLETPVFISRRITVRALKAQAPVGVFQHWSKGVLPKLTMRCSGPNFSREIMADPDLESLDNDPAFQVSEAAKPFTIDGKVDDWANVKHVEMAHGGPIAKFAWRPDGIYGLITVKDNVIVSDRVEFYKNDCIELFVDTDNSKSYTLKPGSVQYVLFPPGPGADRPLVAVPRDNAEMFQRGISASSVKIDGGYVVEFKIDFSLRGTKQLVTGRSVGINFSVDNGGATEAFLHIRPGDRSAYCALHQKWGASNTFRMLSNAM